MRNYDLVHWRKRPLGRFQCRWEDNIKMYLEKMRCEGVEWIKLRTRSTDEPEKQHTPYPGVRQFSY
jgi:hypothetical protein